MPTGEVSPAVSNLEAHTAAITDDIAEIESSMPTGEVSPAVDNLEAHTAAITEDIADINLQIENQKIEIEQPNAEIQNESQLLRTSKTTVAVEPAASVDDSSEERQFWGDDAIVWHFGDKE